MSREYTCLKRSADKRQLWLDEQLPKLVPRMAQIAKEGVLAEYGFASDFHLNFQYRDGQEDKIAALGGSFNICVFLTSQQLWRNNKTLDVVLRMPYVDRVHARSIYESEISTQKYLQKHITIPLATVISSGFDQALNLPYMLMQEVEGYCLDVLATSWKGIEPPFYEHVVKQMGDILNQLLQLKFDKIGSLHVTVADDPCIEVCCRPLSLDMEDAITYGHCYFDDIIPLSKTFDCAEKFYETLMQLHWRVFYSAPHLVNNRWWRQGKRAVERQYVARKMAQQSLPDWSKQVAAAGEQLALHLPDLRAGNIMVDPDTYDVLAVIDLERAHVIPLSLYTLPSFLVQLGYELADPNWYDESQAVWQEMLQNVHQLHNRKFDVPAYFKSRSVNDYWYAIMLQTFLGITSCVYRSNIFSDDDFKNAEVLTKDEQERVQKKADEAKSYDDKLHQLYSHDEIVKLHQMDTPQAYYTESMDTPNTSNFFRRRTGINTAVAPFKPRERTRSR